LEAAIIGVGEYALARSLGSSLGD